MSNLPPVGTLIKIVQSKNRLFPIDQSGHEVAGVPGKIIRRAWDDNTALKLVRTGRGREWKPVPIEEFEGESDQHNIIKRTHTVNIDQVNSAAIEVPDEHEKIVEFINSSYQLKPKLFKIDEVRWKFAIRSVIRGDNLLIQGDSGFGKTLLANILAQVFGRPFYYFNLGATQDARSTLIGNTHFSKDKGTYVAEALFVKAIQTPNAIILLDEVSRAHEDAHNILMTVLDKKQRYLRIDERPDTPTIKVADGVTFIGTANVGSEYTATRVIDRAFLDRCSVLVMPHLTKEQEVELLSELFPTLDPYDVNAIASIAAATREEVKTDNPRIDTVISTRVTTEMAALMYDGFSLTEVAEIKIYPFYSDAGGTESPQTYMRQLVQKYVKEEGSNRVDPFKGNDPNNGKAAPF